MTYDVIIAGLGAMGSAAAFHLARRGVKTLGLDACRPPHASGSSHGGSRIIRQAYFEHPQYVPLVQRAYECWGELHELSGMPLLERTGGLMIGKADSSVVTGALRSAALHGLAHSALSTTAFRTQFPLFRPTDETVAVWEPDAGVLDPERCIEAHLAGARNAGAELRFDEPMLAWEPLGNGADDGVRVDTASGSFDAGRLIVAAGSWTTKVLPALQLPLTVERCVQHWFEPASDAAAFSPSRFPVFIWEYAPGRTWYGIPTHHRGVKLALHHQGNAVDADTVSRTVLPEEIASVRDLIERMLPAANGAWRESSICCYTNTPDEDFIIDSPQDTPALLVLSPCSGHGFKFSSVIGEVAADLIVSGATRFDMTPFRLSRFSSH